MEFSLLADAVKSKSYDKIAGIYDELMLQGIAFQDEWPYAIHLLGHLYNNDINSARFLWKTIPAAIKEGRPELVAVWKIGQKLWTRDYAGVHEALRDYEWSPEVRDIVLSFSGKLT
nr:COP9 signalosome complex subunit 8 [Ipomoea batatas]